MKLNTWAVAASSAAICLALSGCGSSASSSEEDTIHIGVIAPLTGAASVYGKSITEVMQVVVDDTNKAGGIEVAGKSYNLDLALYDDEQKPEAAQSVARKALDEGMDYIVGPFGSGTASSVQSIMAQSDAFWQLSTSTVDGPTKNPNVFRSAPGIAVYADTTLDWLKKHPEIKRIAVITDQMHTGFTSQQDSFRKGVEALGVEVVLEQKMKLGDTDFRAPITQMLAADVDLYILNAYPSETIQITKQVKELGGTVPLQWKAGLTNEQVRTLINDNDTMARVTQATPLVNLDSYLSDGNETALKLSEALGGDAGPFAASAFDGMQILLEGFKGADEVSPAALQKSLAELKIDQIKDRTLQEFLPQDGDRVFKDREVLINGSATKWDTASEGWVLDK
jgi:branched-chain amino acid transport system substrate-binding protein